MKKLVLRCLQQCGGFALARAATAHRARILTYHNFSEFGKETDVVSVHLARQQLDYLQRHFRVVPLNNIVERLRSGIWLEKNIVALTIDDGRRNCYEHLFPLLQEFGMPATFFVVSSFIGGRDWIWTDKVLWLSEQPNRPGDLDEDNLDGFFVSLNRLRPDTRNARIAAIADHMGIQIPKDAPATYSPCRWEELREMVDSGLVEIGSHTVSHPVLSTLTDQESWEELTTSRAEIEQGLGRPVTSFSFPNGNPYDYRSNHLQQIREAGYSSAVVTRFGLADGRDHLYELPRIGIGSSCDPLTFAKYLDGAEHYQARMELLFGLRGRDAA